MASPCVCDDCYIRWHRIRRAENSIRRLKKHAILYSDLIKALEQDLAKDYDHVRNCRTNNHPYTIY